MLRTVSVTWCQTVGVAVTLSVGNVSSTDALVFTPMPHHAVLEREPSMTHVALKRALTCTPASASISHL